MIKYPFTHSNILVLMTIINYNIFRGDKMFFIMGITEGRKKFEQLVSIVCPYCGNALV